MLLLVCISLLFLPRLSTTPTSKISGPHAFHCASHALDTEFIKMTLLSWAVVPQNVCQEKCLKKHLIFCHLVANLVKYRSQLEQKFPKNVVHHSNLRNEQLSKKKRIMKRSPTQSQYFFAATSVALMSPLAILEMHPMGGPWSLWKAGTKWEQFWKRVVYE